MARKKAALKTKLIIHCLMCRNGQEIQVFEADFYSWMNGRHIQTAMPYLTPAERELLISRTCDNCWKDLFTPEIEEA